MKTTQIKTLIGIISLLAILGCQKGNFLQNRTTEKLRVPISYYVSPNGSNDNIGTMQSAPFRSIEKAAAVALPGDVVYLMAGVFNYTTTIAINNSGTADNYITYTAMPGVTPKIVFSGNIYNGITINGSYIIIKGLEFQGDNSNLTYANALSAYNAAVANGANASGTYNTNGISIGGPKTESKLPHHIEIRNCIVHDFPGGGISSIQADYTTIEGNVVYNNAWYSMYAPSGISILNPYDSDTKTSYKNIVRRNICYNNRTSINWISVTPNRLSDGNGIIIDVNNTPGFLNPTAGPYGGRTLVEDNVSFNNGGSGIHSLSAGHVDIINNTAYANGQVVGYADIFASYCNDVNVINNVAYARNGGKTNNTTSNVSVNYDYNIYFNSSNIVGMGPHDIVADPQFVNLSTDPAVANFQLKATSPAVNSATATFFSAKDFLGVNRPVGGGADRGAYESF